MRGRPATHEMDLWRVSPEGGKPEQLTHLNTDIAFPTPIDERTVLFVAHNKDGAGPWLWEFDGKTQTTSRVSSGLEQYTALAATADGRRLVAGVVNAQVSLWSVPITRRLVEERDVEAFQLPTSRSQAPRFGGGTLFYLSSRDGADGLWSYRDGKALEIWKGSEGALQSPAAVSADGNGVAFALTREGKQQMQVMRRMEHGSGLFRATLMSGEQLPGLQTANGLWWRAATATERAYSNFLWTAAHRFGLQPGRTSTLCGRREET